MCVADMDKERADAVAGEISASGGRAIATELDVCQAEQWAQAVAAAEEAFGHLDLLANLSGTNYRVSFDEQSEEMWRKIIEVNLTACFIGIKEVVPAMRRAGRGVMLHVGSLGSIRQGAGSRQGEDYAERAVEPAAPRLRVAVGTEQQSGSWLG